MNKFKNGIETKQHQNYEAISQTIGRDARPVRKLKPPVFEEDLKTAHTPNIAFMHSVVKGEFRRF